MISDVKNVSLINDKSLENGFYSQMITQIIEEECIQTLMKLMRQENNIPVINKNLDDREENVFSHKR